MLRAHGLPHSRTYWDEVAQRCLPGAAPLLSELREPKQRIQLKRRRSPVGSTHNSQARVAAGNRSTLRLNAYLPAGSAPAEEHSMSRTRSAESEADSAAQPVSATSRVDRCHGCVQAAPVGVRVSCRGYARSRSMAVARDWDGSRTGVRRGLSLGRRSCPAALRAYLPHRYGPSGDGEQA
jgi:hypothetical protein